jgi:hypothetical protein
MHSIVPLEVPVSGILQRPQLEQQLAASAAIARKAEARLVAALRSGHGWSHERVGALSATYTAALHATYRAALVLRDFDEKDGDR